MTSAIMEDESAFYSDSKFKQFCSAVDKALKSFEYSSEWADLISCLGKLNKIIQTYPKFPVIPRKLLVGKRLAQCLHPALPSGVHLKTLETYRLIFNQIGSNRLGQDIFIYSSGLFPLLGQASMSVKPVLLDVYEQHFLPIGKSLLPALPGLILALLPGIEEASEYNARTLNLLEKICKETNQESFFSALWGCVLHSPSVRLSAFTFVLSHLSKQSPQIDTSYIVGNNKNLMVNALCGSLEDSNVLVQRITLDFLLSFLPIHAEIIHTSQIVNLLMYSLTLVLRRDMSLNRRLYQWILNVNSEGLPIEASRKSSVGSDPSGQEDEAITSLDYFDSHSKKFVVAAVINLFYLSEPECKYSTVDNELFVTTSKKYDKLKPFRILISLLDKPEIGSAVLEDVLIEVFRVLYRECKEQENDVNDVKDSKQKKGHKDELIKTANLLFNAFEPYFLWDYLEKLLTRCFGEGRESTCKIEADGPSDSVNKENLVTTRRTSCSEIFTIIDFLLDIVSLEAAVETQTQHWPSLLNRIVKEMTSHINMMKIMDINQGLCLALKLLSKVSPSIKSPQVSRKDSGLYGRYFQRSEECNLHDELTEKNDTGDLCHSESEEVHLDSSYKKKSSHSNLMHSCIDNSKLFFTEYVSRCLSPWLASKRESTETEEELLKANETTNISLGSSVSETADNEVFRRQLSRHDLSGIEATDFENVGLLQTQSFTALCRYLVELSCFPSWKSSVHYPDEYTGDQNISDWVQSLVSCASQSKDFNIQSAAMGTLLDLINVSLCVYQDHINSLVSSSTANVVPLITREDFTALEKSHIYKNFATSLWNHIQRDNCQLHYTCTELFLRLHNISTSAFICEDVISGSMVHHNLRLRQDSHWKFAVLWHLSREFYKNESSKSSRGGNRTLDRCMLLMLDSVFNEDPNIRGCVQEWLKHAIHYGDIGRLLEPLLLVMLNPSSRRISVHYASLWKCETQDASVKREIDENFKAVRSQFIRRYLSSTDTESDDDHTNGPDNAADSNDSGIQRSSRASEEDADAPGHTEDSKTDSVAENEFADDEDDDPNDRKEDIQEQASVTSGTEKTASRRKHQALSGVKKHMSIDDIQIAPASSMPEKNSVPVHPLHVHRLFYTQLYDTTQTIYALKQIMSIIEADGRAFVCAAATTSMNMCNTGHQSGLRELLIRHRRALTGKDFYGSLAESQQLLIKASTAKYMEILLSISLYFVRSDYHFNLSVTDSDREGTFCVKILSIQLLTRIVEVLLEVVADSGAGFSNFVLDLFSRCKVQRIALHCLLSHVYTLSSEEPESHMPNGGPAKRKDASIRNYASHEKKTFDVQKQLLRLIKSLVFLEERIGLDKCEQTQDSETKSKIKLIKDKKSKGYPKNLTNAFEYIVGKPIATQPMLLAVVLSAIREEKWHHVHHVWIEFVISILPKSGASLPKIAVPVADQISLNLKNITSMFDQSHKGKLKIRTTELPVDYMLTLLEDLTSICHYCLIDNEPISSGVSMTPRQTGNTGKSTRYNETEEISTSIFSNLVHVFSPQTAQNKAATTEEVDKPIAEAREGLLSILPAIFSSLVNVWHTWSTNDVQKSRWRIADHVPLPIGNTKSVRQSVLQFLTPLAMQHSIVFLAAVADVWNFTKMKDASKLPPTMHCKETEEKIWLTSMNQKILPKASQQQNSLLEIIMAIKVLSLDKIIETAKQIARQALTNKSKPTNPSQSLEVNLFQFLHGLILQTTSDQLFQVKNFLLSLLKDALQINVSPPALFVLLNIFFVFIVRVPPTEERRARKELQDLAQKFFETCNAIAGASLDSSAWFRRSVAVVQQSDQSVDMDESSQSEKASSVTDTAPIASASTQTRNAQYSAQALCVMAELLSSMMDLLYLSEEKDKIASSLFYVMYNTTPYLKNHSSQNITSFRACSALLSAVTDYQYTLRAWKKDVYELFLDNDFFRMDLLSFNYWRAIIDRLMTYDAATFKDLMTRINLSQSGAINIFANREQEMEQRAQLLKRLTFTIFCGEVDQYHNHVPDIQERLVESLKQMQAPVLHEQVLFCFRVLILRMSPHHLTSLWPPIVTELILVFLQMERDLASNENQQSKSGILGTLESFFGMNGIFHRKEKRYGLYLEACKLLDLALTLHNEAVPHFQLYRWAFIDTPGVEYNINDSLHEELSSDRSRSDSVEKEAKHNSKKEAQSKLQTERQHVNKQDKGSAEAVSKLSVMNAPLTSKLRKGEKKSAKKKSSKDKENENTMKSKFVPYLSKILKLLSQTPSHVEPEVKYGRPLLEMKKISSLEELLPFLVSVTSVDVSGEVSNTKVFDLKYTEKLIDKDFQEIQTK